MERPPVALMPARQRHPVIWQWLVLSIAIVLVGGIVYYGAKVVRSAAFTDERAFRVLSDIGEQLGNLQLSRATTLSSMPIWSTEDAVTPCPTHPQALVRRPETDPEVNRYLAKLDLFQPRLCAGAKPAKSKTPAAAPADFVAEICDQPQLVAPNETVLRLFRADRRPQAAVVSCDSRYSLQESFEDAADYFAGQTFFDDAVLALEDGTVVLELPRQRGVTAVPRVDLHPATAQKFNVTNVVQLLQASSGEDNNVENKEEADEKEGKKPASKAPKKVAGQPQALDYAIGNRTYRVYVLPISLPFRVVVEQESAAGSGSPLKRETLLYLIGIQRADMAGAIQHALWPHGTWLILVLSLLTLLAWPLLTLAFEPAEESISWRKAMACVLAALLIPALLMVVVTYWWSLSVVNGWMSANAREYANSIEARLHAEIVDGVRQLSATRALYRVVDPDEVSQQLGAKSRLGQAFATRQASPRVQCSLWAFMNAGSRELFSARLAQPIPIRYEQGEPVRARPLRMAIDGDECITFQLRAIDGQHNWSPLRNLIALDADGNRMGPMLTAYGIVPVRKNIQLADRAYFQALQRGQFWVTQQGRESLPFVAQRLFNRSDASRALQLAVPLCVPATETQDSRFCGIITGDTRVHSLIASISPPLLEFAVIDQATGTVLFHSDDRRSLAENFFRETDDNAALRAAIRAAQPASFGGDYLGSSHGFYYLPLRDTPWGIVTFYSRKALDDLPLHATGSTLATYGGAVLGVLLLGFTSAWLWTLFTGAPRKRRVAAWLWPSLSVSKTQRHLWRWRPSVWAIAALGVLFLIDQPARWWIPLLVLIVTAVLARLLMPRFSATPNTASISEIPDTPEEQQQRAAARIECMTSAVFVVVMLPVLGLFMSYHDLQLAGLIRDGLVNAGHDVQARHTLIRRDLQRWVPPEDPTPANPYPDAETIVRLQEPDYFGHTGATLVASQPWSRRHPTPEPNPLQAQIWQTTAGSTAQVRRLKLLTASAPVANASTRVSCQWDTNTDGAQSADRCTLHRLDGTALTLEAPIAQAALAAPSSFSWSSINVVTLLAILLALLFSTDWLMRFLGRRLFGLTAAYQRIPPVALAPLDREAFRTLWKRQSPSEQLLLYDLALGELPNPRHEPVIRSLLEQGLIQLKPWPVLSHDNLAALIKTAEEPKQFAAWRTEAASSPWRSIRLPLFIVVILIVAWLNWAAGGTMKAFSALALGTIAFLTQITQLFGFARGSGASPKPGS